VNLVHDLPSLQTIPTLLDPQNGPLLQPTRFFDRTGQTLLLTLENPGVTRRYLYLDETKSPHLSSDAARVMVAVTEPRFWSDSGVRFSQLTNPQPVTITEQLVSDLLLWQEPAGFRKALRMRILAAQLIARYGREQVLEWYLNSAAFGHLAYGMESAAQVYLGKSAADLDVAEAAVLAAANQAPALNPLDAPAEALERQKQILKSLRQSGVLQPEEYNQALDESMVFASPKENAASLAPAYTRQVLETLSQRFSRQRIERGGLSVQTALDAALQRELACLAQTQLARLSGQPDPVSSPDGVECASARLLPTLPQAAAPLPADLTASAVVMDPESGQVLAMLGDAKLDKEADYSSPRPAGSVLTPFVALAGFSRGYSPATLSWDIPAGLSAEAENEAPSPVYPNPDGRYHGPVRMRVALANDYLAPVQQLVSQLGASNVWRLASELGLSDVAEEHSEDLIYTGGQVSPLNLAQSYSVFANQGVRVGQRWTADSPLAPVMVLSVKENTGSVWLAETEPEKQTALSAPLTYLIHSVLSDSVTRRASLGYPNPLEIGRPSGAKIGQVLGEKQVWTAGYIRQRVAVFSLTLADEKSNETLQPRMAAGMWHALMQYMGSGLPALDWPEPDGIVHQDVCDPSGMLPTQACPQVVNEVFLSGSQPTALDPLYQAYQINRETGLLATVFTPPELVEEKVFLVVPSQARGWAEAQKIPTPPQRYDAIQPSAPSESVRIVKPDLFGFVRGKVTVQGIAGGKDFRSYQVLVGQGLNPTTWQQIGSGASPVTAQGALATWDTGSLEGLYAVRLQVVRQDQTVETATIQVTVDNIAPLVNLLYPAEGQSFQRSKDRVIVFQVNAEDALGVQRVVWLVDGKQVAETTQAPFVFSWSAVRGKHELTVQAVDQAGNVGKAEPVSFSVQ
jgi:membrane peptidoglycan carboxypeptidase